MTRSPQDPEADDTVGLGKGGKGARAVWEAGAMLAGRYQIVDLLGQGGMGAVYLATDEALAGKPIALKVVARALDAGEALEELRSEVLLAQQVTHRNVCRIYDLERIEGRWTLKMEWIAGETLVAVAARGPMPVGDVVPIARQIALGLAAAHREGVVHRDLKPANVMIEAPSGRVVLMDFGIAQAASGEASSDQAGTPAFMAPEQARGERVDARSDVYALGCTIRHMLGGRAAPAWLRRAVNAMTAADPAQRPRDASAVLVLLDTPVRRRRALAVAAGAVVIAAAGVAGAAAIALGGRGDSGGAGPRAWQPAIQELEPAFDENVDSVAWSPDGARLAFSTDRERPGWLRARVREGERELAVSPPEHNALFVSWSGDGAWLYYTDIAGGMTTWRVPAAGGGAERIGDGYAVDCGGKLLRFEFSSPGCPNCPRFVLRDAGGGEREALRLDSQAFVSTYRCDRAGKRVVWARAEQGAPFYQPADLWIADLASGAARQLTTDRRRNSYPGFTPDGESVVFASARGGGVTNLWELALASGRAQQLTFGDGNDLLPEVSPDGRTVAFTVDVTSAPLFSRVTGASGAPPRLTPARVILIHPQAMPDGREILAADFGPLQPRIVAVAVADGHVRTLAEGVIATVTPDGAEVVYVAGGTGATTAALRAMPAAGGASRPLGAIDGRVRALRAGPDRIVHAMVDRGSKLEAWRIPLDGGALVVEAGPPWCFVQPAPAGGWSMWMRCDADGPVAGVLVAPGASPDVAAPGLRMDGQLFFGGEFSADGGAYFVYEEPRLERVEVATGAKTTLFEAAVFGATVSPDGTTVYSTEAVGRSRRHLLTNFADRPPL